MRLSFFTKPDCTLCVSAWFVVEKVARRFGVTVERVDISAPGAEAWFKQYRHDIPVVHLDGVEIFRHRVSERALREIVEEAGRGEGLGD